MAAHRTILGRIGTAGAALLAAGIISACSADTATSPEVALAAAKPQAQTAISARYTFAPATDLASALRSDAASTDYRDTVCGVTARVFRVGTSDYRDGNLQLDNNRAADQKCLLLPGGSYPRKFTIQYPDNLIQTNTGGLNVFNMGTVGAIPEPRSMNIRIVGTGARCTSLAFGSTTGSTPVTVTRTTSTTPTWSVALTGTGGMGTCTSPSGATTLIGPFIFAFTVTLN